jgi:hypothetical protein
MLLHALVAGAIPYINRLLSLANLRAPLPLTLLIALLPRLNTPDPMLLAMPLISASVERCGLSSASYDASVGLLPAVAMHSFAWLLLRALPSSVVYNSLGLWPRHMAQLRRPGGPVAEE